MFTSKPEVMEGKFVFMQNIRRATRKHRRVLLVVVILLMLGLVGTFATWNSASRGNIGNNTATGNEPTLEQQIDAYLNYIETLKEEAVDYSGYLNVASAYIGLNSLYTDKYNEANSNLPVLDPPEYDEEGNEIPLDEEGEAARAAAEAEYDAAVTAATAWQEHGVDAAKQAESYYQLALDNPPEGLNDIGIANVLASQAQARDLQGNTEGAITLMKEAYKLSPDDIGYLLTLASFEQKNGNLEDSLAHFEEASEKYPDDAGLIANRALVLAQMDEVDQARELYLQARELAPEDFNIAYSYAAFVFERDSYEAGIAELAAYRDSLPEENPNIAQADSIISYWQALADMFANMNVNFQEDDDENGAVIEDDAAQPPTQDATGQETETAGQETDGEATTGEEIPDQQ